MAYMDYLGLQLFSGSEIDCADMMAGEKPEKYSLENKPRTPESDTMGGACGCIQTNQNNSDPDKKAITVTETRHHDEGQADVKTMHDLIESQIQQNRQLEKELNSFKEDNKALLAKKLDIEMNAAELKLENERLRKSSDELTEKMATLSHRDSRFVNASDETSPVRLGRLSDSIQANDWFKAYTSLHDTEESEIKILEFLSKVMQTCLNESKNKSEAALRQFLFLQEEEVLPSDEEMKQLYQLRRSVCHEKARIDHVVEEITAAVVKELAVKTEESDTNQGSLWQYVKDLEVKIGESGTNQRPPWQYVSRCTELCWLAVTSSPPLYLEFEVKGRVYKDIQAKFQPYSAGIPVVCDSVDDIGSVATVVWPAVLTDDRADVYMKGSVLLYDKVETKL